MSDKLVAYIEHRKKKYGHVEIKHAVSSIYYTFGNWIVRISDHIKYGAAGVKKFDFSFIIQPNDTYIFTASPKLENGMGKMYMKISTLQEAKDFVKKLHDFAIAYDNISDVFRPEGWKINVKEKLPVVKISWSEFYEKYIEPSNDSRRTNICDWIEFAATGALSKGKADEKVMKVPEIYESLSSEQYEQVLQKLEKANLL